MEEFIAVLHVGQLDLLKDLDGPQTYTKTRRRCQKPYCLLSAWWHLVHVRGQRSCGTTLSVLSPSLIPSPPPPWPCRSSQLEFRRLQTWFILNQVLCEWVDPHGVRWCVAGGVALIPAMVTGVYLLMLNVGGGESLLCGLSPQSDFCHSVLIIPIHISSDSYCALVHKDFSYISDFNCAQIFLFFRAKILFFKWLFT